MKNGSKLDSGSSAGTSHCFLAAPSQAACKGASTSSFSVRKSPRRVDGQREALGCSSRLITPLGEAEIALAWVRVTKSATASGVLKGAQAALPSPSRKACGKEVRCQPRRKSDCMWGTQSCLKSLASVGAACASCRGGGKRRRGRVCVPCLAGTPSPTRSGAILLLLSYPLTSKRSPMSR